MARARQKIGIWLSDHSHFKTHGRPISRDIVQQRNLTVIPLEADPALQDAVLSIYHAAAHTFIGTGAVKIIENHLGRAYLNVTQPVTLGIQPPNLQMPIVPNPPAPQTPITPPPTRR
jgi:hypothetical protein